MNTSPPTSRCGIDTVEISRMEKLLADLLPDELARLFTVQELTDAGNGVGRAASLAARFAAKEACCKLFPRETSLGHIEPSDFSVRSDGYGAPQIVASDKAQTLMDRHRIAAIRVSLTHTEASASAVTLAEMRQTVVPWFGKWIYHVLPIRRQLVMCNLRRVFGEVLPESEIVRLAQAYYAHFIHFFIDFIQRPFMSSERRKNGVRVENMESPTRAHEQGKGLLLLTGHFGNWEVATVEGLNQFPQYRGLFHLVRRPLKPKLLNDFITRRIKRAGFGTLAKRGSLDEMLELLGKGAIVVFVFDQHASRREGVSVDFFGHPAGTNKSLAIIAETTGAPVIPVASWREPDGTHVLRFEDPLPRIESDNPSEFIRLNTRTYNEALERILLRHPEQWIWMHKRWKGRI